MLVWFLFWLEMSSSKLAHTDHFQKNGCHMIKPTRRLLKSTKEVALISFHSPWDSRHKTAKWRPLISIFADEYCSMQASAKTLLHKRISFLEVKTQSPTKPIGTPMWGPFCLSLMQLSDLALYFSFTVELRISNWDYKFRWCSHSWANCRHEDNWRP